MKSKKKVGEVQLAKGIVKLLKNAGNIEQSLKYLTEKQCEMLIRVLLTEIKKRLSQGEKIIFFGYFTLSLGIQKQRNLVHPKTKLKMSILSKITPKIRFSNTFKNDLRRERERERANNIK